MLRLATIKTYVNTAVSEITVSYDTGHWPTHSEKGFENCLQMYWVRMSYGKGDESKRINRTLSLASTDQKSKRQRATHTD